MRFPSLIRLPKYKRFEITPRHYDPIKEEIEARTARIKSEMNGDEPAYVSGRINFERRSKSILNTSFLQLIIAATLGLTVVGWLYYGNVVFYALWLFVPIYLFFRFRKPRQSK